MIRASVVAVTVISPTIISHVPVTDSYLDMLYCQVLLNLCREQENNFLHPNTEQYSAEMPRILTFMWMQTDTNPSPKQHYG